MQLESCLLRPGATSTSGSSTTDTGPVSGSTSSSEFTMDKMQQQSAHNFDQHQHQDFYYQRFRKHSLAPLEYPVDINTSNAGGSCTFGDPMTAFSGHEWIDDPNFKLPEIHFDDVPEIQAITSEALSVSSHVTQPKEECGVLVEGAEMSALLPPQTVLEEIGSMPVESWMFDSMELLPHPSCYSQQALPGPQVSSAQDGPMIQHPQAHFHQHQPTPFHPHQTHEEIFLPSFQHPLQQHQHLHTVLPPLAQHLTPHHGHQNQNQLQAQRQGVLGVGGGHPPARYPEQKEYHVGEFVLSHRPSMDACELFGPFMASNSQGANTITTNKTVSTPVLPPAPLPISAPLPSTTSPAVFKRELPMTVSTSTSPYQAELRILTSLNDRYWKNGRKNLQCFPTCPEHNDFFSMKMNNRKHSSVGVCRGPVYCQLVTQGIYKVIGSSSSSTTTSSSKSSSVNYRLPHGVEVYVLGRFERVPQRNDTKMMEHLTPPTKEFTNSQEFEFFRNHCFQAVEMEERRNTTTYLQQNVHQRPQSGHSNNKRKIQSTWFFLPDVWKVQPMLKKKRKATRSAPAQTFPFCFRTFVYVRRPSGSGGQQEDNKKVIYQCLSIDTSSFFELYSTRTVDRVKRKHWHPDE